MVAKLARTIGEALTGMPYGRKPMVYSLHYQLWYIGKIIGVNGDMLQITYPGWRSDHDEMVHKHSDRLDCSTGGRKKWRPVKGNLGAYRRVYPTWIPTDAKLDAAALRAAAALQATYSTGPTSSHQPEGTSQLQPSRASSHEGAGDGPGSVALAGGHGGVLKRQHGSAGSDAHPAKSGGGGGDDGDDGVDGSGETHGDDEPQHLAKRPRLLGPSGGSAPRPGRGRAGPAARTNEHGRGRGRSRRGYSGHLAEAEGQADNEAAAGPGPSTRPAPKLGRQGPSAALGLHPSRSEGSRLHHTGSGGDTDSEHEVDDEDSRSGSDDTSDASVSVHSDRSDRRRRGHDDVDGGRRSSGSDDGEGAVQAGPAARAAAVAGHGSERSLRGQPRGRPPGRARGRAWAYKTVGGPGPRRRLEPWELCGVQNGGDPADAEDSHDSSCGEEALSDGHDGEDSSCDRCLSGATATAAAAGGATGGGEGDAAGEEAAVGQRGRGRRRGRPPGRGRGRAHTRQVVVGLTRHRARDAENEHFGGRVVAEAEDGGRGEGGRRSVPSTAGGGCGSGGRGATAPNDGEGGGLDGGGGDGDNSSSDDIDPSSKLAGATAAATATAAHTAGGRWRPTGRPRGRPPRRGRGRGRSRGVGRDLEVSPDTGSGPGPGSQLRSGRGRGRGRVEPPAGPDGPLDVVKLRRALRRPPAAAGRGAAAFLVSSRGGPSPPEGSRGSLLGPYEPYEEVAAVAAAAAAAEEQQQQQRPEGAGDEDARMEDPGGGAFAGAGAGPSTWSHCAVQRLPGPQHLRPGATGAMHGALQAPASSWSPGASSDRAIGVSYVRPAGGAGTQVPSVTTQRATEGPPVASPDPPVASPDPPVASPDPPVASPDPPVASPDPPVASGGGIAKGRSEGGDGGVTPVRGGGCGGGAAAAAPAVAVGSAAEAGVEGDAGLWLGAVPRAGPGPGSPSGAAAKAVAWAGAGGGMLVLPPAGDVKATPQALVVNEQRVLVGVAAAGAGGPHDQPSQGPTTQPLAHAGSPSRVQEYEQLLLVPRRDGLLEQPNCEPSGPGTATAGEEGRGARTTEPEGEAGRQARGPLDLWARAAGQLPQLPPPRQQQQAAPEGAQDDDVIMTDAVDCNAARAGGNDAQPGAPTGVNPARGSSASRKLGLSVADGAGADEADRFAPINCGAEVAPEADVQPSSGGAREEAGCEPASTLQADCRGASQVLLVPSPESAPLLLEGCKDSRTTPLEGCMDSRTTVPCGAAVAVRESTEAAPSEAAEARAARQEEGVGAEGLVGAAGIAPAQPEHASATAGSAAADAVIGTPGTGSQIPEAGALDPGKDGSAASRDGAGACPGTPAGDVTRGTKYHASYDVIRLAEAVREAAAAAAAARKASAGGHGTTAAGLGAGRTWSPPWSADNPRSGFSFLQPPSDTPPAAYVAALSPSGAASAEDAPPADLEGPARQSDVPPGQPGGAAVGAKPEPRGAATGQEGRQQQQPGEARGASHGLGGSGFVAAGDGDVEPGAPCPQAALGLGRSKRKADRPHRLPLAAGSMAAAVPSVGRFNLGMLLPWSSTVASDDRQSSPHSEDRALEALLQRRQQQQPLQARPLRRRVGPEPASCLGTGRWALEAAVPAAVPAVTADEEPIGDVANCAMDIDVTLDGEGVAVLHNEGEPPALQSSCRSSPATAAATGFGDEGIHTPLAAIAAVAAAAVEGGAGGAATPRAEAAARGPQVTSGALEPPMATEADVATAAAVDAAAKDAVLSDRDADPGAGHPAAILAAGTAAASHAVTSLASGASSPAGKRRRRTAQHAAHPPHQHRHALAEAEAEQQQQEEAKGSDTAAQLREKPEQQLKRAEDLERSLDRGRRTRGHRAAKSAATAEETNRRTREERAGIKLVCESILAYTLKLQGRCLTASELVAQIRSRLEQLPEVEDDAAAALQRPGANDRPAPREQASPPYAAAAAVPAAAAAGAEAGMEAARTGPYGIRPRPSAAAEPSAAAMAAAAGRVEQLEQLCSRLEGSLQSVHDALLVVRGRDSKLWNRLRPYMPPYIQATALAAPSRSLEEELAQIRRRDSCVHAMMDQLKGVATLVEQRAALLASPAEAAIMAILPHARRDPTAALRLQRRVLVELPAGAVLVMPREEVPQELMDTCTLVGQSEGVPSKAPVPHQEGLHPGRSLSDGVQCEAAAEPQRHEAEPARQAPSRELDEHPQRPVQRLQERNRECGERQAEQPPVVVEQGNSGRQPQLQQQQECVRELQPQPRPQQPQPQPQAQPRQLSEGIVEPRARFRRLEQLRHEQDVAVRVPREEDLEEVVQELQLQAQLEARLEAQLRAEERAWGMAGPLARRQVQEQLQYRHHHQQPPAHGALQQLQPWQSRRQEVQELRNPAVAVALSAAVHRANADIVAAAATATACASTSPPGQGGRVLRRGSGAGCEFDLERNVREVQDRHVATGSAAAAAAAMGLDQQAAKRQRPSHPGVLGAGQDPAPQQQPTGQWWLPRPPPQQQQPQVLLFEGGELLPLGAVFQIQDRQQQAQLPTSASAPPYLPLRQGQRPAPQPQSSPPYQLELAQAMQPQLRLMSLPFQIDAESIGVGNGLRRWHSARDEGQVTDAARAAAGTAANRLIQPIPAVRMVSLSSQPTQGSAGLPVPASVVVRGGRGGGGGGEAAALAVAGSARLTQAKAQMRMTGDTGTAGELLSPMLMRRQPQPDRRQQQPQPERGQQQAQQQQRQGQAQQQHQAHVDAQQSLVTQVVTSPPGVHGVVGGRPTAAPMPQTSDTWGMGAAPMVTLRGLPQHPVQQPARGGAADAAPAGTAAVATADNRKPRLTVQQTTDRASSGDAIGGAAARGGGGGKGSGGGGGQGRGAEVLVAWAGTAAPQQQRPQQQEQQPRQQAQQQQRFVPMDLQTVVAVAQLVQRQQQQQQQQQHRQQQQQQ